MKNKKMSLSTQLIIGFLSIVVAIMLVVIITTNVAKKPYSISRSRSIEIAKNKANLESASVFDIVNTDQTVYSVRGKSKDKKDIAVLISQPSDSGKKEPEVRVVDLTEGVAPDSLPAAKSANYIRLGLYKNGEVWEVRDSSDNYKLYDFKTGEELL
ncbi:hypothetical protein BG262_09095 [Floricoccus penangensis]|uniref:Cell wall elongation regulator TseB-like domain-containing protein n=2 Tax=Floricoccus penangensis TaxID=1859475 RepID=A0A9Q5JHD8_9LACT|nr:hypothetical protein BG262_09095 [Floricoccus penangensis]